MMFDDECHDKGEEYEVNCRLLPVCANTTNCHLFYEYISNIRKLPKPFRFYLDTTQGKLLSIIPFVPTILMEAKKGGVSKCLSCDITMFDSSGLISLMQPVIESFSSLTQIKLHPI